MDLFAPSDPNASGDRSSQLLAGSVVLIVLPTVAVCLRLASRWMTRASLWWDDYAVIVALIFSYAPNILNIIVMSIGFGKHLNALPEDVIFRWFKMLWIFELTYFFALGFVKFSIILFQYRIFPIIHFRRVLIGCGVFVTCWLIACVLTSIFQCVPVEAFWHTLGGVLSSFLGGKCVNVKRYFLATGSLNVVTNFFLLAMPIPLLWNLKTGKTQKLILTLIFTVGFVVCAVSIVRLVLLAQTGRKDMTWTFVPVTIWTSAETSIGVVSACLPSLRPLFARMIWGRTYQPKRVSGSTTFSGGSYSWPHPGAFRTDSRGAGAVPGAQRNGSFNRLQDQSPSPGDVSTPWTNRFAAYGGSRKGPMDEEFDLGFGDAGDRRSMIPPTGIRVRTTVTVTEKVDWQDNLF